VKESDFKLIGWREVPVNESTLGPMAFDAQPKIFHLVVEAKDIEPERVEPMAYILRKKIEIKLDSEFGELATSVASFSSKTIVYKGML
jgi:glutamate synthase (NADPH/NADH) large chain